MRKSSKRSWWWRRFQESSTNNGGCMHFKTSRKENEGEIRRVGWLACTVGALLLISVGLELLAHQVFGQIDMETLIWSLYLGFWTYVLGSICFLILVGLWCVDWRRVRASRVAMNQLSPTESTRRRVEGHEFEDLPYILEQGIATERKNAIWLHSKGKSQSSRGRPTESGEVSRSGSQETEPLVSDRR